MLTFQTERHFERQREAGIKNRYIKRENISGGGVCVHTQVEGRLGEGPQFSRINSMERRGTPVKDNQRG